MFIMKTLMSILSHDCTHQNKQLHLYQLQQYTVKLYKLRQLIKPNSI